MFQLYSLVRALHLIALISWMAGILYLFRLFVYHSMETEAVVKVRFEVMERRLFRLITLPAMAATLVCGVILLFINPLFMNQAWLHWKLLLVIGLIGMTLWAAPLGKRLQAGTCTYTSRQLRLFNEVPTVLMILIVLLAVLKPFF